MYYYYTLYNNYYLLILLYLFTNECMFVRDLWLLNHWTDLYDIFKLGSLYKGKWHKLPIKIENLSHR